MVSKKITKKIISKEKEEESEKEESLGGREKRGCSFCRNNTEPTYTDISGLKKFLNDRRRIMARAKTALCSKHQRRLARQIKYARHLALLPFTPKV